MSSNDPHLDDAEFHVALLEELWARRLQQVADGVVARRGVRALLGLPVPVVKGALTLCGAATGLVGLVEFIMMPRARLRTLHTVYFLRGREGLHEMLSGGVVCSPP